MSGAGASRRTSRAGGGVGPGAPSPSAEDAKDDREEHKRCDPSAKAGSDVGSSKQRLLHAERHLVRGLTGEEAGRGQQPAHHL